MPIWFFRRYVNRPWSLFCTTLNFAFLICTEFLSETMPVRDAKACDVVDGTIEPIDEEE